MRNNFLISGMFRTGTTMFARMLHSNPNIICASDPFAPIYKSYRNTLSTILHNSLDKKAPLHDYYFDKQHNDLFQEIQKRDFSILIEDDELASLKEEIEKHCRPYSPKIISYLDELKGNTYEKVFDSGLGIIQEAYAKPGNSIVGFKEVWVDEFAPHFLKMHGGNKVIHLIRDPRSVIASNFASGSTYPLLFLLRQWRKSASLACLNSQRSERTMLIRFEDLLTKPEAVISASVDFLGVDFHPNMTNPSSYLDGSGRPWKQNTSYGNGSLAKKDTQLFNKTALDNWKKVLSDETLEIIERFCSFEMKLLGYELTEERDIGSTDFSILDYQDDSSKSAAWIQSYANYNNFTEISVELMRLRVMQSKVKTSVKTSNLLFLDPDILKLRAIGF